MGERSTTGTVTPPARRRAFGAAEGHIAGSVKDRQSITSDWEFLQPRIDGVQVREVKHVPKSNGYLTEVFRSDWGLDARGVDQVFQNVLLPGGISGWHVHRFTTDRIFVTHGLMKLVLYDARTESPTYGQIDELNLGALRPALVVVPPGVWHAVENVSHEAAALLNLVDAAYRYEDPDHWRLPIDTPEVPYSFGPRA